MAVLRTIVHLRNLGCKEVPEELSPTELPKQWRQPRRTMAPQGIMDVNWRRVEGGPKRQLQCSTQEFVPPVLRDDGKFQDIAYASRLLSETEKRHAPIEKEDWLGHLRSTGMTSSVRSSLFFLQMAALRHRHLRSVLVSLLTRCKRCLWSAGG